jgi:hemerythrin
MSGMNRKIFEWTPEYSVHDNEIDREHQAWLDGVNRLHQAMLAGKGTEIVGTLLEEMMQYTSYHFAHEARLMAAIQYPEIRAHVQQHNELRRKVGALVERFGRGEATITIELTLFLSEWIKQHILTSDRRLGEYLITSGRATTKKMYSSTSAPVKTTRSGRSQPAAD